MNAYAYRSGVIKFGPTTPKGAMPIASGRRAKVLPAVTGLARLAYDGKTLLVPGIPEAASETEAMLALERFCTRVRDALRRQDHQEAA